jgi:hypothetical protein
MLEFTQEILTSKVNHIIHGDIHPCIVIYGRLLSPKKTESPRLLFFFFVKLFAQGNKNNDISEREQVEF